MLSSLPHNSRWFNRSFSLRINWWWYRRTITEGMHFLTVVRYPFPSPPLLLLHFEGKRKENTTGTCARKDFFGFPAGSKEDLTKLPITWSCYGFVNWIHFIFYILSIYPYPSHFYYFLSSLSIFLFLDLEDEVKTTYYRIWKNTIVLRLLSGGY